MTYIVALRSPGRSCRVSHLPQASDCSTPHVLLCLYNRFLSLPLTFSCSILDACLSQKLAMSSQGYRILILGGGVAGLTTAMALIKFAPENLKPTVHVFEIRPQPGVVGGAINLTPNALRLLDHLDILPIIKRRRFGVNVNAIEVFSIYKPYKLAESSFRGPNNEGIGEPPYKVNQSRDQTTCAHTCRLSVSHGPV